MMLDSDNTFNGLVGFDPMPNRFICFWLLGRLRTDSHRIDLLLFYFDSYKITKNIM